MRQADLLQGEQQEAIKARQKGDAIERGVSCLDPNTIASWIVLLPTLSVFSIVSISGQTAK